MAKGCRCRDCGGSMYAQDEQYQEQGTWVKYVCMNNTCKMYVASNGRNRQSEKKFEPKR